MKSVRVLIVVALGVCLVVARHQLWYSVHVSRATLLTETPRVVQSLSKVNCAIRATHDPRAYLLCPQNVCALYNLRIGATHDDTAVGPTDRCWTKFCKCVRVHDPPTAFCVLP